MISKGTTVLDFIKELPGLPFDGGLTVKILRIEEGSWKAVETILAFTKEELIPQLKTFSECELDDINWDFETFTDSFGTEYFEDTICLYIL